MMGLEPTTLCQTASLKKPFSRLRVLLWAFACLPTYIARPVVEVQSDSEPCPPLLPRFLKDHALSWTGTSSRKAPAASEA
jgi:hypothetical protein